MVANYEIHGFKVTAAELPESCTACPFWMVDIKTLEEGGCYITGTKIRIDGPQDEKRMDDCPIEECCAKSAQEKLMNKKEKNRQSITDLLDDTKTKMCNEYCRYPFMPIPEGKDDDWLAMDPDSPCKNCPLDML